MLSDHAPLSAFCSISSINMTSPLRRPSASTHRQRRGRRRSGRQTCSQPSSSFFQASAVAVVALLSCTLTTADDSCPDAYDGFTSQPGTDCTKYVYCINGVNSGEFPCPSGTLFDGLVCNWAASVKCDDGGSDVGSPTAKPTAKPSRNPTPNPTRTPSSPGGTTSAAAPPTPLPTKFPTRRPTPAPVAPNTSPKEPTVRPTDAPTTRPPTTGAPFINQAPSGEKTIIGYYAGWQWYDRDKKAAPINMDFQKVDRINYAFFQTDYQGNLFGTDSWGDPQLLFGPYDYAAGDGSPVYCSWDGPNEKACASHKYEEGLIHLAKKAGAEVYPSIGGWTLSDPFPTVAASASARRRFAIQCVQLIQEYDFDGIDLDWEYPGYEDHSGTPDDKVNFNLLLNEVRSKLDTLSRVTGKFYGLTAALPCGPSNIANQDISYVASKLTELNLMTYDFHGAWDEKTGTNAPLYEQGWGDPQSGWSVHGCVDAWINGGGDRNRINIGLPFYGRSYRGADGLKQTHDGVDDINWYVDDGSPQYFNILARLGEMDTHRDEVTKTQYAVFRNGEGLVSYDDPRAICDKVEYAHDRGLHGFIIWELSGDMLDDLSTPLLDMVHHKLDNPWYPCDTPQPTAPPVWAPTTPYAPPPSPPSSPSQPMMAPSPPTPTPPTYTPPTYVAPSPTPPSPTPPSGSSTSSDMECPPGYTGRWTADSCTKYFYCVEGRLEGTKLPCVPGTLFDVQLQICNWAQLVMCGG